MNFSIIKEAGISVSDFARIANVSRVTVSLWVNGKILPHRLHIKKINQLLVSIEKALDAQMLPIPKGLEASVRLRRIKEAIIARANNVKSDNQDEDDNEE